MMHHFLVALKQDPNHQKDFFLFEMPTYLFPFRFCSLTLCFSLDIAFVSLSITSLHVPLVLQWPQPSLYKIETKQESI
jgi:hypothetical protein